MSERPTVQIEHLPGVFHAANWDYRDGRAVKDYIAALEARLEEGMALLEQCRLAISSVPHKDIFGSGNDDMTRWYFADVLLSNIANFQKS